MGARRGRNTATGPIVAPVMLRPSCFHSVRAEPKWLLKTHFAQSKPMTTTVRMTFSYLQTMEWLY